MPSAAPAERRPRRTPGLDPRIWREDAMDISYRALAAGVILQALREAAAGDADAVDFLHSDRLELWAEACGMDAEALREAVDSGDRRRLYPSALGVRKASRIFCIPMAQLEAAVEECVSAGLLESGPLWRRKGQVYVDDLLEVVNVLHHLSRQEG